MAKEAAVEKLAGFDELGQAKDTPKGEVDLEALQALQERVPEPLEIDESPTTGDEEKDIFLKQLQDPEVRRAIGLPPLPGLPLGEWNRDYDNEKALKVYGGIEVRHAPGFCPKPPGYISMYVAPSGRTTNHVDDVFTPGGVKMHEGALKDKKGNPLKSMRYKQWIDKAVTGQKLDGNVRFDIIAEENNMAQMPANLDGISQVALIADGGGL